MKPNHYRKLGTSERSDIMKKPDRSVLLDSFMDNLHKLLYEQNYKKSPKNSVEKIKTQSIIVDIHARQIQRNISNQKRNFDYHMDVVHGLPKGMHITNYESLIHFCQIHGFFPFVNRVYFDGHDITKIQEFEQMSALFCFLVQKKEFNMSLFSEITKLLKDIDYLETQHFDTNDFIEIGSIIEQFGKVRDFHKYTFGLRSQRNNTGGTLSEKLYIEVASRLENEVRDKLNIDSTYMKLASYTQDTKQKIDLMRTTYDRNNQQYNNIPIQLTIASRKSNLKEKIRDVESMLIKNKQEITYPFYISAVEGGFREKVINKLSQEYNVWKNKPSVREAGSVNKGFPYFIDMIGPQNTSSAQSNYIMLHIIHSALSNIDDIHIFPIQEGKRQIHSIIDQIEQGIESSHIKCGNIHINKLSLDKKIYEYIEKQTPETNEQGMYKICFPYSYKGQHHGTIVVYI